jgi:hypothetical protein
MFGKKTRAPHPTASTFYSYLFHPRALTGAGDWSLTKEFADPPLIYTGTGTQFASLRILAGPRLMSQIAVPTRGIGGTQAGQITFLGLSTANAIADARAALNANN